MKVRLGLTTWAGVLIGMLIAVVVFGTGVYVYDLSERTTDTDEHDEQVVEEDDNAEIDTEKTDEEKSDGEAAVEYYPKSLDVSPYTLFTEEVNAEISSLPAGQFDYFRENKSYYVELATAWRAGRFTAGPYVDWELLIVNEDCEGPCFDSYIDRFAYNSETRELVLLTNYQDEYETYMGMVVGGIATSDIVIPSLEFPEEIEYAKGQQPLVLLADSKTTSSTGEPLELAFSREGYDFYLGDSRGCLTVFAPDGTLVNYGFLANFFEYGYDDEGERYESDTTVTFNSGDTINIQENYTAYSVGCAIFSECVYLLEDVDESLLEPVGESSTGVEFYEWLDPSEANLPSPEAANSLNSTVDTVLGQYSTLFSAYKYFQEGRGEEGLAADFNTFMSIRPILFYKDPLGRWSAIISYEARTPVECAKPVIYLYPEQTEDIAVKVDIVEFTETIPDHGKDGWYVQAQPDGTIYNYADGQEYPYLFWEGHKKGGIAATRGFVIKRTEVPQFLRWSLAEVGLNKQERADFIEYWEPLMLEGEEPYLQVSFVGTEDFNRIAPLSIKPEPDTLFRIFMYYEPLKRPIALPRQNLRSFDRSGFTVVEWGGTSAEAWREKLSF